MADDKKTTPAETNNTAKTEAKKEVWLNWLAITTILFSAAATLATFRGGGLATRAVLTQSTASDNWAYYQSKSVKQHTYEIQRELFQIQMIGAPADQASAYKKRLEKYEQNIERYKKEKLVIFLEAKTLEAERQRCQDVGAYFGLAIPYLQVAIMLSALAALMKKKPVWMAGCIPGAMGMAYFIVGTIIFQTSQPLVCLLVAKP
ncbi:MAG: DUF4337 domain-containing protein [Verrucomicrobiota bacterium]